MWLTQVECAFSVAGISSTIMKFNFMVAGLPADIASQVKDVIMAEPDYEALVKALRERLATSRIERLELLLKNERLGDQRPSQLLRKIRSELTTTDDRAADTSLLRTLFLQRLPSNVRAALSLLPMAVPLDDLAQSADRFLDQTEKSALTPLVAGATCNSSQNVVLQGEMARLTGVVEQLSFEVRQLQQQHANLAAQTQRSDQHNTRRYRGRSHSRNRQQYQHESNSNYLRGRQQCQNNYESDDICWYHKRFGANSTRCTKPCKWDDLN